MEKVNNLSFNLEKALTDSTLPGVLTEYSELVFDSVLKEGVLKDVPIIGSVIGGIQFANSLQKHFLSKKLYKFLFELKDIPEEVRRKKIAEINNSKKYASGVGEMIFELLEKIDSDGKPEIIGKLFKAVIEEEIDYRTYLKVSHLVKSMFYYDLLELKEMIEGDFVIGEINDAVFTSGLIDKDFNIGFNEAYEGTSDDEPDTKLTELGKILINIGME